jgi:acyl transferase domain-containing protein/thioesterase domain-containing protein
MTQGEAVGGGTDIAVVGMAGRFPGARTTGEYWRNLRDGVEAVTAFSDDELRAAGVDEATLRNPKYVKSGAVLPDVEQFDAAFFGFSPRDAAIMDPQHRHFVEVAWEALEDAGYTAEGFAGPIGVFGGSGMHAYLMYNLLTNPALIEQVGMFLIRHTGNDKDFLTTRVSYLLNLRGPSINVQTACSTSLVAIHMASQSLLNGECDMALAGGVTIEVPHRQGYLYQEGEILSADGHCRAFDARSEGTIFGSGAGVVVLRRLEDAIADGDHIYAVVKGSAVNNDGSLKAGYLAPSVEGQASAVAEALALSGVPAESISYVEAHGTGTPVGDPIEVAALTQAFRTQTDRSGYCALGSVKTNIGHLDTAAGVAGFIKVALSLEHGQLPPSLHYETPNPRIDFAASPFFVNNRLRDWAAGGAPRRGAINSLGVGGTNAFAILEEPPAPAPTDPGRAAELLVLSARSEAALDAATRNLARHLREHPAVDLADVAYTLQTGRKPFAHRRVLAASDVADAVAQLEQPDTRRVFTQRLKATGSDAPSIVFMFPGGAAQYPNMGRELYEAEPVYRQAVDEGLRLLRPHFPGDLKALLFPAPGAEAAAAAALERPSAGLPAIFITEYALARLWRSWGVEPAAMTGHSLGEYACACLAGVMTLEDALSLVALRGELFERIPDGAMLSVRLPEEELRPLLTPELSLAAVNAPGVCAVSGLEAPVAALEAVLSAREVEFSRLKITVPAHSALLDPILEEFGRRVATFRLSPPTLPWVSNLTGTWITPEEATDAAYWVRHLRQPVRFSAGIKELLQDPNRVFLEVGPGQTLGSLVKAHEGADGLATPRAVIASTRHPQAADPDVRVVLTAFGRLWAAGVPVAWALLNGERRRRRLPLPTYPFEHQRHWIEPGKAHFVADAAGANGPAGAAAPAAEPGLTRLPDVDDWFSRPVWREAPLAGATGGPLRWLVFAAPDALGEAAVARLRATGQDVVRVLPGPDFVRAAAGEYRLNPGAAAGYRELLSDLTAAGWSPQRVLHLWSANPESAAGLEGLPATEDRGFYSLLWLAQALGAEDVPGGLHIGAVTDGLQPAGGAAVTRPERAVALGPVKVIPREYPGVTCQSVDVAPLAGLAAGDDRLDRIVRQIVAEVAAAPADAAVAYRGDTRLVEGFERTVVGAAGAPGAAADGHRLRQRGVYLITGGLGGIGLVQAEHLARTVNARLVLVGRNPLPPREQWAGWLVTHTGRDVTSRRIRQVQTLEALGAEVLVVRADVTSLPEMRAVVDGARERFGQIDGVIHAAGVLNDGVAQLKTREGAERVLAPKVQGTLVLDALLRDAPLDFLVLFSSTSAILGPAGQVDYAGANAFLNAYANSRAGGRTRVVAVDWGVWQGVGMAVSGANLGAGQDLPPLEGQPAGHPLLGVRAGDTPNEQVYRSHYRTDELWLLDEHRLKSDASPEGQAIVPGTGYLEIARAAVAGSDHRRPVLLTDVFFLSPLAVPDGSAREVRVTLERQGTGAELTVASTTDGSWQEHARGTVVRPEGAAARPPARLDLEAIRRRCAQRAVTYQPETQHTRQEDFVLFGPRWKNLRRVDFGKTEALAALELPEVFADDLPVYAAHPALLDLALHAGLPLVPGYDTADDFYVPFSCKRVRIYAPLTRAVFSHVRYFDRHRAGGLAVFDVTVVDAAGRVLLVVEEFTLKRLAAGAMSAPAPADGARRSGGRDLLDLALEHGIPAADGAAALARVIEGTDLPQVVASSIDLRALLRQVQSAAGPGRPAPGAADGAASAAEGHGGAPRNDVERTLAGFWQELMGLERVGIEDNFFDVGGYSLIAVRLFAKIKKAYGIDLSLSTLFEAPTIATCAQVIAQELGIVLETDTDTAAAVVPDAASSAPATPEPDATPAAEWPAIAPTRRATGWSPLVEIQSGKGAAGGAVRPSFFCVHGAGGNVLNFRDLAVRLGPDQPFYGLQARGVDGKQPPLVRVEDMAALYISEIRRLQPHGPYFLGGYSGGGVIAFEMAQQLRRAGEQTAMLVFIDTFCPTLPIRRGVTANLRNLRELGFGYARVLPRKGFDTLVRFARRARVKVLRQRGATLPHKLRDLELWDTHLRALAAYQPDVLSGMATLFRAAVSDPSNDYGVDDLGWTEHLADGVEIRFIPGTHDSLVMEPNVTVLANELRACIDRAARSSAVLAAADEADNAYANGSAPAGSLALAGLRP